MYRFGKRSKERLKGVKPELVNVLNELIKIMDVTIIEGLRTEERQKELVRWLLVKQSIVAFRRQSCRFSSYPIDWEDRDRFSLYGWYD